MTDITFTSADYLEIRRRGVLLNAKFQKLSSEDIKTCAPSGIWHQKALVIDSEDEMDYLPITLLTAIASWLQYG